MAGAKTAVVCLVLLGATTLAPAAVAETDSPADAAETFCSGYQNRYNAMTRQNERLLARYEAAQAATSGAGASGKGPKPRGNSAPHGAAGGSQGLTHKAAALVKVQARLAARSVSLANRVASECNATIAPIAAIVVPDAAPTS